MSLGEYREKIDEIDAQILALFEERMRTVRKVAEYKQQNNLPIFHPEREQQLLEEKAEKSSAEYRDYTRGLFHEIMRLSKEYQKKIISTL